MDKADLKAKAMSLLEALSLIHVSFPSSLESHSGIVEIVLTEVEKEGFRRGWKAGAKDSKAIFERLTREKWDEYNQSMNAILNLRIEERN